MKKIECILLSVALIGATSCTEEIIVQNGGEPNSPVELTFSASNTEMESNADTRTLIREGGNVLWIANDRISLFANGNNYPFITKDGGSVTNFRGTVNETADTYYAVYPYNRDATISGNTITTVLYDHQYAEPGSFASGMNLSVSMTWTTTGQDLAFLHSAAWLRVFIADTYSGDPIKSMRLKGNNNEYLAGDVTISVDLADFSAKVIENDNAAHTIYLDQINANETFIKGKWYYFVLAPQTFEQGFTLTLVNEDGEICDIVDQAPITFVESEYHQVVIDNADFKRDEEGCGMQDDGYYHVNSLNCLYEWATLVQEGQTDLSCYIDVNEIDFAGDERIWPQLGTVENPFTGEVLGNGVTIKNLNIDGNNQYTGFIGALGAEGVIKDINFETPVVKSSYEGDVEVISDDGYVGVVVGLLNKEKTNNYTQGSIINCHVINPTINGGENVGGIVGRSFGRNDAITNCTVSGGTIQGCMFVGGIVGNSEGIVENCHVKGTTSISYTDVQSEARVGGIVGTNNSGQVVACTANAIVTGSANTLDVRYCGGIAGANNGTIIGCASSGKVVSDYGGAIAGESYGDIYGCYANQTEAAALIYKIKKSMNDPADVTLPTFKACYWKTSSGNSVIGSDEESGTVTDCAIVSDLSKVLGAMDDALDNLRGNTDYAYGAYYEYERNAGDDKESIPYKAVKP